MKQAALNSLVFAAALLASALGCGIVYAVAWWLSGNRTIAANLGMAGLGSGLVTGLYLALAYLPRIKSFADSSNPNKFSGDAHQAEWVCASWDKVVYMYVFLSIVGCWRAEIPIGHSIWICALFFIASLITARAVRQIGKKWLQTDESDQKTEQHDM